MTSTPSKEAGTGYVRGLRPSKAPIGIFRGFASLYLSSLWVKAFKRR